MKVLLSGGGTGGHIYPAIAIADKIKEADDQSEILFVGTERGKEQELIPAAGYEIEFIQVQGLDRKHLLRNVKVAGDFAVAVRDAARIMERFQPDVVIGTGGYVSAPVLRAALKKKIPTYIQEQNALPGLTNKMMESKVQGVFLGFHEASSRLRYPEKHFFTGNPVREAFFHGQQSQCRKQLNIPEKDFVLLAFGGSQGAGRINKAMESIVAYYNGMPDVTVVFVPGKFYYLPVMTELLEKGVQLEDNIRILEYIHQMEQYLPAADLIISRSGALTISEIAVCGKGAILIPSPMVTGDHQTFNAKVLSELGGAFLMEEKGLTDATLLQQVESLRMNPGMLAEMGEKNRKAVPGNATEMIYREISK